MEYNKFIERIVKEVQEKVEGDVTVTEVRKNNGVNMDGLLIQEKGRNISPIIYLNPYYRCHIEGKDMREIVDDVCEVFLKSRPENDFDMGNFMDFDQMKSRIVFRLVNYRMNRALLKEIPHQKYLDLAVIFECLAYDHGEKGQVSVLIYNEHLDCWGVSAKEVAKWAYANTPELLEYEFVSMGQILNELCGNESGRETSFPETKAVPAMIILTNRSRLNGAACLLYPDILEEFSKKMDSNLVILPSSIHEVILISVKQDTIPDREELRRMICDINETDVADTEVLSDHPYFYNRITAEISVA